MSNKINLPLPYKSAITFYLKEVKPLVDSNRVNDETEINYTKFPKLTARVKTPLHIKVGTVSQIKAACFDEISQWLLDKHALLECWNLLQLNTYPSPDGNELYEKLFELYLQIT